MRDATILVLGATGQQGGATTRHLLAAGWRVRALTRDPGSEKAKRIAAMGAELVAGRMEDPATLDAAMAGVHGVYSVQPPTWVPSPETDAEEARIGKLVADVARTAGVQHLVYASAIAVDEQRSIRTEYKAAIEDHIRDIGIPATILRPATFMENYTLPPQGLADGTLFDATAPEVPIGLIAVDDIGFFAARAFGHPERYLGATVDLIGDYVTPPDVARALSDALGRAIEYRQVQTSAFDNPILAELFAWVNREGYPTVDLEALRAEHPGMLTFEAWLRGGGAARIAAALEAAAERVAP
ncbi:MAG TPA: NmrA/HSCARG family protein [Longimicrobiales bacterium]